MVTIPQRILVDEDMDHPGYFQSWTEPINYPSLRLINHKSSKSLPQFRGPNFELPRFKANDPNPEFKPNYHLNSDMCSGWTYHYSFQATISVLLLEKMRLSDKVGQVQEFNLGLCCQTLVNFTNCRPQNFSYNAYTSAQVYLHI